MFERGVSYKLLGFPFFPITPPTLLTTPIIEDFNFIFALALIFHSIWISSRFLLSSHKKAEAREKNPTKPWKCLFMNWTSR